MRPYYWENTKDLDFSQSHVNGAGAHRIDGQGHAGDHFFRKADHHCASVIVQRTDSNRAAIAERQGGAANVVIGVRPVIQNHLTDTVAAAPAQT